MPEVQADFVAQGATVETSSPQALTTLFKDELASWGSIVKSANVKME